MINQDIFYNRQQSGYAELMSYYPSFWKGILEMRVNNKFAGYTLDRAAADLEQAVLDQFFETCSVAMLRRYEIFLNLDNSDKDLEDRRRFLKIAWNGTGKISVGKIVRAIMEFYDDSVEVDAAFTDHFEFFIRALNADALADGNIERYLQSVIPAHIAFAVVYERPVRCRFYAAGGVAFGEVMEIRQVF